MKKLILLSLTIAMVLLEQLSAQASLVNAIDGSIGLYGIQWENGISKETRFQDAIDGILPEIFLEDDYLNGTTGGTGFILAASYLAENPTLNLSIDYQGNTLNLHQDADITTFLSPYGEWYIWWINYKFIGGTNIPQITRMFAEINYGGTLISEEILRPSPAPEPATILLMGTGLLGLLAFPRLRR